MKNSDLNIFSSRYLVRVRSFKRNSQILWYLQMKKHTVRPKCSYQDINDVPKTNGGHNFFEATFLNINRLASSSSSLSQVGK